MALNVEIKSDALIGAIVEFPLGVRFEFPGGGDIIVLGWLIDKDTREPLVACMCGNGCHNSSFELKWLRSQELQRV